MKKSLLFLIIIFIAVFGFWASSNISAQFPNFEIYGTSSAKCEGKNIEHYPALWDFNYSITDGTEGKSNIYVSANICDVSGVSSAVAILKNSQGIEVDTANMEYIGENLYSATFLNKDSGNYSIEIFVADYIRCPDCTYTYFGENITTNTEVCATSFGAQICVVISIPAPENIADWPYNEKITISSAHVDSDLINFPLYVKINANSDIGEHSLSDGRDIRFTDSEGNLLSYEREYFAKSDGKAYGDFWVKIPTISHSQDTVIYIYYGKADAVDGQDATNVWDSNYKGVWHLPNGTTLSANDSTSNHNNGTNNGVTATVGKADGAGNFNGSSGYVSTNLDVQPSAMVQTTWNAFIMPTTSSGNRCVFSNDDGGYDRGLESSYSDGKCNIFTGSGYWAPVACAADQWHHVALVYATNNIYFYKDGVQYAYGSAASGQSSNNKFYIGKNPSYGEYFQGKIDEVRVSNTARSASWIKFEYYNMSSDNNYELMWGEPLATAINPFSVPSSATAGETINLSATLKADGEPLSGQTITFTDEMAGITIGSAQTNSLGIASITYRISLTASGQHTLKANYGGNVLIPASPSFTTGSVNITNTGNCSSSQGSVICVDISTNLAWLSGWQYRKQIIISNTNINSDLEDFPLYVKISSDSAMASALASALSNGYDIRFTDSDGVSLLSYERESWSGGGGSPATADFWVKVPNLYQSPSADQNKIYVYYGKAGAADGQSAVNVWDSNYKGVWHMKDLTTSIISDSLGTYNGTKRGANEPIEANGKFAKAQSFDGSNDYIYTPAISYFAGSINPITIDTWLYIPSDFTWVNGSIAYMLTSSSYGIGIYRSATANSIIFAARIGAISSYGTQSYTIQRDTWYHLVIAGNGSTFDAYANGVKLNTSPKSYGILSGTTLSGVLRTGSNNIYGGNGGGYLKGFIDETRVSSIARPAEWIKFEYYNMSSASNELTWGNQESI